MIALLVAIMLQAPDQEPMVARTATIVLKVVDRAATSDVIAAKADELGGYFISRSDTSLNLRIPHTKLAELDAFASARGVVVTRQLATQDLGAQIENARAIIATREQLLRRYVDALSHANADSVVTIEREATRLVQEIEAMKGTLRVAEHHLAFAQLMIAFEIRDRGAPARDGTSSFKWVNTVNLADLIEAFQHGD